MTSGSSSKSDEFSEILSEWLSHTSSDSVIPTDDMVGEEARELCSENPYLNGPLERQRSGCVRWRIVGGVPAKGPIRGPITYARNPRQKPEEMKTSPTDLLTPPRPAPSILFHQPQTCRTRVGYDRVRLRYDRVRLAF